MKENKKPIVLMLSWFYGQPKQINKYSKLYTDKGMDVLVGRLTLFQLMFSVKSIEVNYEFFLINFSKKIIILEYSDMVKKLLRF